MSPITRSSRYFAVLLGISVCAVTAFGSERPTLRFDFEAGDLQGWRVVEGTYDTIVCDRQFFHDSGDRQYNHHGRFHLTTLHRSPNRRDDSLMGVLESPVFRLVGERVSFLVGGGAHKNTYVALCTLDGQEVRKGNGRNKQEMLRYTWDVTPWIGEKVYLKVVDRNPGGWGHATFDDFQANATIDKAATTLRFAKREREMRETRRVEFVGAFEARAGKVRRAIEDLRENHRTRYRGGDAFLARLDTLTARVGDCTAENFETLESEFGRLRYEALSSNPLLAEQPILFVARDQYVPDHHNTATMFQNGEINTASFRGGSALKTIHFGEDGRIQTILEVPAGIARDPELHFDGKRILFSMRKNIEDDYHIYEMDVDGGEVRQLTSGAELSDIDPMVAPTGDILFVSTREPKLCQCNRHIMGNLFKMNADGSGIHQLGRNTLFEGHPALMPDGRILYDRWEYVDKQFGPAQGLWTVNPDGTNHAVYYGNNAWSPGGIIDARTIPGTERFVANFTSCHDRPWGALAVVDRRLGSDGVEPIVKSWPEDITKYLRIHTHYGDGMSRGHPAGAQIDNFVRLPIKYEDPYPLSETYFLCSRMIEAGNEKMGLYLLDLFGNELLLHEEEQTGCFDPMPVSPRKRPDVIPERRDFAEPNGLFYVADVYRGDGMEVVARGTVKWLRVVEAPPKLFWTETLWNLDATQAPAMNWNCTNNKRILGKVPVEEDGSAYFSVPADTFVFFQLLDENEMMVQTMRSGTMVQAGERTGCVGCHENRLTTIPNRTMPVALGKPPRTLEPWYGAPRDFNYLTEVQPVFDRHCVSCHDYGKEAGEKLILAGDIGLVFNTSYQELRSKSALRWFPDKPGAPKLLVKAVDDGPAELVPAYAWGSHRSRLVDVIRKGHQDVKLDKESFDRIVTWIDMNAPYYGSYASVYPGNAFGRSPLSPEQLTELQQLTGVRLGDTESELVGSQVNFTRPELSPCLAKIKKQGSSRYRKALSVIRAGQTMLVQRPRMDMPGAEFLPIDDDRQEKYNSLARLEAENREAILRSRQER